MAAPVFLAGSGLGWEEFPETDPFWLLVWYRTNPCAGLLATYFVLHGVLHLFTSFLYYCPQPSLEVTSSPMSQEMQKATSANPWAFHTTHMDTHVHTTDATFKYIWTPHTTYMKLQYIYKTYRHSRQYTSLMPTSLPTILPENVKGAPFLLILPVPWLPLLSHTPASPVVQDPSWYHFIRSSLLAHFLLFTVLGLLPVEYYHLCLGWSLLPQLTESI